MPPKLADKVIVKWVGPAICGSCSNKHRSARVAALRSAFLARKITRRMYENNTRMIVGFVGQYKLNRDPINLTEKEREDCLKYFRERTLSRKGKMRLRSRGKNKWV